MPYLGESKVWYVLGMKLPVQCNIVESVDEVLFIWYTRIT